MPEAPNSLPGRLLELALQKVTSHGLILLDPRGTVVGWLAGAERALGYRPEEIIGKNISIIFTPEEKALGIPQWEQTTAEESDESEDDRWQVRQDGGRIWVSGTMTALRDEKGRVIGFAKVIREQTDQKLQVEVREGQIEELKRADQRKNEFITVLAHELRNPLAAISSACDLLHAEDAEAPAEMTLATGIMRRQVEFMGRMISDLLEMARTARGKVQLKMVKVGLQEVIREAIEVCKPKIDAQTHTLVPLLPEGGIEVEGDRQRLRQVFINLIENAVKYTEYGGTIWVKASTEGKEGVVRVQDTGIGIAPEMMPHIFDLFTQAEFASGSEGGLGIGLSVVKDIVTIHGGTVQVMSGGLGKGSEFTVRLPLAGSGSGGDWNLK